MKKIICFLVLLAFVPGLHADNKKKKGQQQSSGGGGGHVQLPGGGGGGGGMHMPGLSHGPSQPHAAAPSRPSIAHPSAGGMSSGGASHSGMSATNPLSRHSPTGPAGSSSAAHSGMSANNPLNHQATAPTGGPSKVNPMSAGGSNQSAMSASNPLGRRSNSPAGGASANMNGPSANNNTGNNPMMRRDGAGNAMNQGAQMNNQAAVRGGNPAGQRNGFSGNNNPMGRGGAQAAMHDRNPNAFRAGPNRNASWAAEHNRAVNPHGYARGYARGWAHPAHANYHVRGYREVFHGYHRAWHDRYWYGAHYDRVVVYGGGYYYWDGGYWYPAWGYDPAYSVYVYDGPIYSYANLPPDQVIVNVQTELQDQGYYAGEIDGQLGPQTRDALGAYQADHNLEVTSAIDEPTVEALGLT